MIAMTYLLKELVISLILVLMVEVFLFGSTVELLYVACASPEFPVLPVKECPFSI